MRKNLLLALALGIVLMTPAIGSAVLPMTATTGEGRIEVKKPDVHHPETLKNSSSSFLEIELFFPGDELFFPDDDFFFLEEEF